jgi:nicotinamidase-related amidase
MSLQRIIELARRQGMPVILTDVAGREPMVVLPLEA